MVIKEYNSERTKLIFPEYGRHIQNMVKELLTISDREKRTQQAHVVIEVMGNLNSNLRDTADFKHKLWDHLFLLSEFKLDVDSPYEIPTQAELSPRPDRLEYPKKGTTHKQYGRNIREVIQAIKSEPDSDKKSNIVSDIAKFMKFKSYEYNQEYPSDEVVINDLIKFSGGEISLEDNALSGTRINTNKKKTGSQSKMSGKKDQRPQHRSNNNNQNGGRKPRVGAAPSAAGAKRFHRHKNEA